MYNPISLEGKAILVTGASSGIGRALAIECSKMGATVLATGRNYERLNDTFVQLNNSKLNVAINGDLANEEFIEKLVFPISCVDGIVFCAGISDTTLIKFSTKEKFLRILDIDLLSQVSLIRTLLDKKKVNKKASLVFMSSMGAYRLSPGLGLYSAAKSGLISIMKSLAIELSSRGIRSNAILPSMVKTEIIDTLSSISTDDWKKTQARYPFGFGEPSDVALATIYLLSDTAKRVTGSEIVLDGGFSLT
jgi:NAD(P)-dependent dehydrogenase (short-subunit alcohol dehydrogenase family)